MKKIQAPEVAAIRMQFGELKLNQWTSNGFHKLNTSLVSSEILP